MFRTAIFRTFAPRTTMSLATVAVRPRVNAVRAIPVLSVRLNSTVPLTPEEKRKEALKRQDDLQKDWAAPIITYEQLKPRTESPSPVSFVCMKCTPFAHQRGCSRHSRMLTLLTFESPTKCYKAPSHPPSICHFLSWRILYI
jgi:hypothetical protein